MTDNALDQHHVTFDEEDNSYGENKHISIKKLSQNHLQAHLGFMKLNNTYEICVPLHIPDHIADDVDWIPDESKPSCYTSLKSYEKVENQGNFMLVFKAGKAKLMRDTLKLCSASDPHIFFELELVARVLGKGQGTPMLIDGVHSIAVEVDEESEASDWQGFE